MLNCNTVRPEGKERGLKLLRNFGANYSIDGIRKRILEQSLPERYIFTPEQLPKQMRLRGTFKKRKRSTGLRALYYYYLYRMGVLPKKRIKTPNPKRVYFLFREDIRYMQNIAKETRLLAVNKIDTAEQLTEHTVAVTAQIVKLSGNRKKLRYKLRSLTDEEKITAAKSEIAALSASIGELRKEIKLCNDIEKRSAEITAKIRIERESKIPIGKEQKIYEPFRGRG
jgi:hypothetical protein